MHTLRQTEWRHRRPGNYVPGEHPTKAIRDIHEYVFVAKSEEEIRSEKRPFLVFAHVAKYYEGPGVGVSVAKAVFKMFAPSEVKKREKRRTQIQRALGIVASYANQGKPLGKAATNEVYHLLSKARLDH